MGHDGPQLENALLNLCINARDAMAPNGGCITIETANKWLDDRAARERAAEAPGLKVLFITGFAENAVVEHGQLGPGMEIVTKPFVVAAFERKVRDLIER